MKFFINKRSLSFQKKVALVMAAIIIGEAVSPSVSFALTSGPAAPEFSSFEPVTTTNMVDEFSGDFTYNIPILNIPGASGGGYAMSLAYHSGESVESEASWVGYGWSLSPGAINRGKRGIADDTKNDVTHYNDVPKNWTVSTRASFGNIEIFSASIPVSVNASLRYNNYRGFGYTAGAGVSYGQGLVSLGYSVSDGTGSFSAQVNPAALLSKSKDKGEAEKTKMAAYKSADKGGRKVMQQEQRKADKEKSTNKKQRNESRAISSLSGIANSYGMFALSDMQHATTVTPYEGFSINTNFNLQTNPSPIEAGPQFGFSGNYNYQKNKAEVTRRNYGYLYSSEAYDDAAGVMDYYLEKESTYNKRDRYMSIPFSNADMFSVTGEGLGGSFRLYNNASGYFRPNEASSKTVITQVSADISLGLHYGGGFNLGLGQQTLNVTGTSWGYGGAENASYYKFTNNGGTENNDVNFLRYNNDLGGSVDYSDPASINHDNIVQADIIVDSSVPGLKSCNPQLDASVMRNLTSTIPLNEGSVSRSGRASYISYHTNKEMAVNGALGKPVYAYDRSATTNALINRTAHQDQIGEVATVNEDGNTYVYGLPMLVGNETDMQYDLRGSSSSDIQNNFRAKKDISTHIMKIGETDAGSYAATYLLTQITTPDYVDRSLDGPTQDDFGGYTKFQYVKKHDIDSATGYHFRMPYTGLNYSKAELSDPLDDMGSYSSGDKDVAYLNQVVTKTHIAKFFTSDRKDGMSAADDATAANSFTAAGTDKLQKLDSIVLFTNENGSAGKRVKKVIFKYDYSLCPGTPNSGSISGDGGVQGKLTLKEIWFEYDGIITAKISPYKFKYNYPTVAASPYPTEYASFQSAYAGLTENPSYNPFAVDAWGNYQDATTAQSRFSNLQTGVNQAPPAGFDPAAWQMKAIVLPSGGEIHVEYEQDDYLYVQDRRAECLVHIDETDELTNTAGIYTINTDAIGVTTASEKIELASLIMQRYSGDKIYFKFLYALIGTAPDINNCGSDYINGYVNFDTAYYDAASGKIKIGVGNGASGYDLPRDVCLDLVKKQKGGKLNPSGDCNASADGISDGLTVKDMVMQLLSKIGTSFFAQGTSCLRVNADLSYFKIPVLKPKKGGGLRVKRILMYDNNGIDTGVQSLYGSEYFYEDENGKSSGVATNEPASLRDESAIVTFLPKRNEQGFLNKVVSGTDREQFEGPIGESLLPSASVGYSRVVTKNIHSGKTNSGFVVSEFYTVKDYPFDMRYNGATDAVSNTPIKQEKDWMNLPAIVFNYGVTNIWASQGYRFILNSMHGQPKTVATYSGDYAAPSLVTYAKSSSTEYQYYQPGETIKVQNPNGDIVDANPGKDMEVAFEIKSVEDVTEDASIEVDFGVGLAGVIPLPQASLSPLVNYTESKLRTHVTSKVIKYPVIQKAVISTQEGIVHKTENLVFSAYTGKPVRTKTSDGYNGENLQVSTAHDGSFNSYSTPAYAEYKEMGQKAINERANITAVASGTTGVHINMTASSGIYTLTFAADSPYKVCDAMGMLTKGDLIVLNNNYNSCYHIDEITGNSMNILPALLLNTSPATYTSVTNIEIVKSGRTNQLSTIAGNYVTYGAPQSFVTHPADATLTAQRTSFINALNATLPSGGTISIASYPFVVKNDGACTPISNDIVVDPVSGHNITIHCVNTSNYVRNGSLAAYDASCAAAHLHDEFANGCVDYWSQAYGHPQYSTSGSGEADLLCASTVANGILQNGIMLDPAKQYTISFKLQSKGGMTGTVKAMLADPATSGLPFSPVLHPLSSAPGQQILAAVYSSSVTSTTVTDVPFTPVSGNTQLYIYGIDDNATGGQGLIIDNIKISEYNECTTNLTTSGGTTSDHGHFAFDEAGNILFYSPDNDCYPQTIDCFKFCNSSASSRTLANVLTSSAATYACSWSYDAGTYAPGAGNVYENGAKGKWRNMESYVYKSAVKGGSAPATTERNYNDAGTYTMTEFNWKNPSFNNPDVWIKTSTVTKYSPNGDAIEEKDALGIYSAAKFGYNGTTPYLTAQNSKQDFVQFQSFEKRYTVSSVNKFEDGLVDGTSGYFNPTTGNVAHSGKGSYKLATTSSVFNLKPFVADPHIQNVGLSCKIWVKDPTWSVTPIKGNYIASGTGSLIVPMSFVKVAQCGEWILYESKVTTLVNSVTYTPVIQNNAGTLIYIDDVRIQPMDAQVNTYVYNPANLRLLASFDDQHFGLFYQYNQEGKLVRKLVETEKGMKTISETQYHTPSQSRP